MFTKDTIYKDVINYPGMEDVRRFLEEFPVEGTPDAEKNAAQKNIVRAEQSIAEMIEAITDSCSPISVVDGLNALRERVESGDDVVIELYTDEEKAEDHEKERTGILWFPADEKGPFAILCAGGGYMGVVNPGESIPVARRLNQLGISAFVLQYRAGAIGAARKSADDLRKAVQMILENSEKFNVEKRYIAIGFSAGGHLVSQLGTITQGYMRYGFQAPEMIGLAYALVSFKGTTGPEWDIVKQAMFGDDRGDEEAYDTIKNIDRNYPETYLVHTVTDEVVCYEDNALAFHEKLKALGVDTILKEVPHGSHGIGRGDETEAEGWVDEAVAFWRGEIR